MKNRDYFQKIYKNNDPWHYASDPFERIRLEAMVEFVSLINPGTLLDLGCGEGHFLEHLLNRMPKVKVTGVEFAPTAAERCRSKFSPTNVEVIVSDLLSYLESARKNRKVFDMIICSDVLYFLDPDLVSKRVVRRLASMLTPGGGLIICYADINDHQWTLDVFRGKFRVVRQVYLKPMQKPPPAPFMISLLTLKSDQ